jgi:integrase
VDFTVAGKRYRADFKDHGEATRWEADARAAVLSGRPLPTIAASRTSGAWTMQEALRDTYERHWRGMKAEAKTMINANQALAFFGANTPLEEITTERVEDWTDSLEAIGNSGSTINRKLAALSAIFTHAISKGRTKHRPVLQRHQEGEHRIRWLRDETEEEARLWEAFRRLSFDTAAETFTFLLDTGLRPSELERIDRNAWSPRERRIHLWVTKTAQPRAIPVTARSAVILETRLARNDGIAFPEGYNWLDEKWQPARRLMGLADDPQFTPYVLRHTCATRLCRMGLPLNVVKDWMGHKSIATTMRYAHAVPAHLDEARDMLENYGKSAAAKPAKIVTGDVT